MGSIAINKIHNVNFHLKECKLKDSDNLKNVLKILDSIAEKFNSKVVGISHKSFSPHGLSVCYFLSTSHMIYSSWPEHNSVLIDISTCSDLPNLEAIRVFLKKTFLCKEISYKSWRVNL